MCNISISISQCEANFSFLQVKVLHNQLWLLHSAVAAHTLSCHSFLEQNMQQAARHLDDLTADAPSWLEEES